MDDIERSEYALEKKLDAIKFLWKRLSLKIYRLFLCILLTILLNVFSEVYLM